jgi:hypothetical protein
VDVVADVNVQDSVLKLVNEVFDVVVDPESLSNYFVSGTP